MQRVARWGRSLVLGRNRALGRSLVLGGGVLSVVVCAAFHLRQLPGPGGALGHDWSYFLPQLLAGTFWMAENGVTDVPWFTPAWLGGVPFHPNPQNIYWSLPQQLCRFTDPLSAARLTLVTCVAVAHAGAYLLLRRTFGLRRPAAAFGAVVFGWNGYLASRLLIGHVVYHTFALVPLVALLVLGRPRRSRTWAPGVAAGCLLAMVVHSCDLHGLPVAALAVVGLACLRQALGGSSPGLVARCGVAVATAGALSASKLVAMATFLAHFPRDGYALPGANSAAGALRLAAEAVFWRAPVATASHVLTNAPWSIDRHELEYGVSPVVALLLVAGCVVALRAWRRPTLAPLLGIVAVLAAPIALNVHHPEWERVLKSVPILGSGSNLLRVFSLYIPLAAVGAAVALDRLVSRPWSARALAALGIAFVLAWHVSDDRGYYAEQPYRAERVVAAWQSLDRTGAVPAVTRLVASHDDFGRATFPIGRNDSLVSGESQLSAFEPIFGYRLEWLPRGDVRPGAALPSDAAPNVRDPARFLWPDENGGAPGSSFDAERAVDAARFLAYRPYPFARSMAQRVADVVSALAVLVVCGAVGLWGCRRIVRAVRSRGVRSQGL